MPSPADMTSPSRSRITNEIAHTGTAPERSQRPSDGLSSVEPHIGIEPSSLVATSWHRPAATLSGPWAAMSPSVIWAIDESERRMPVTGSAQAVALAIAALISRKRVSMPVRPRSALAAVTLPSGLAPFCM